MTSRAYGEFVVSLGTASALHTIEVRYNDPPLPTDPASSLDEMRGLRGGSTVLMVGAFERFVRQAIAEHLSPFASAPSRTPFSRLPHKMQVASIYSSMELALKGPRFASIGGGATAMSGKAARIAAVQAAARTISDGLIDANALSQTGGNIGADALAELLSNLGIADPFKKLRPHFDALWGKQEAIDFVRDTLDTIVSSRHRVAHSASVLSISRSDVSLWLRFLGSLASAVDALIEGHANSL